MEAKVTWKGRLTFEAVSDSGFPVRLDTDEAVGGNNSGIRPMELMAMSLAGCTAMDVISILEKKRQQVTGFEVRVQADRASEHPKVFTHAVIEYHVTGHQVDEAAVVRAIELSATRYCPAQGMLARVMSIELRYKIYEDEHGKRRLVKEGEYRPA